MSASTSRRAPGTQPAAGPGAPAAVLGDLVADAALQMQARSGGASLCGYAGTGTAAPTLKYSEGRWAALREVQRRAGADDLAAVVAHTRATWVQDLTRRRESGGADWVAYLSGGVEALEEFTERLTGSTDAPGSGMDEDE